MGIFQSCLGKQEYTGDADALYTLCNVKTASGYEYQGGDAKVDALIKAGVNIRYQVRE
jgi:hypothetical protein